MQSVLPVLLTGVKSVFLGRYLNQRGMNYLSSLEYYLMRTSVICTVLLKPE